MAEPKLNEETEEKARKSDTFWEDWWQDDRLDTLGWAVGFIWGALVLFAHTSGYGPGVGWWDPWAVFFTGAGIAVLFGTVIRFLVPEFRRKLVPSLVFGVVLLIIGLGDLAFWVWPLVLLGIGLWILRGAIKPRR